MEHATDGGAAASAQAAAPKDYVAETTEESTSHERNMAMLVLGALGVVYGDIGTSPLYAIKECFNPLHGVPPTADNVLGVLSLIFWALVITISTKYMRYVMRADNRGEGGILALMSLAQSRRASEPVPMRSILVVLGLFGAALLYGDGMITPAISVLSAVEGLTVSVGDMPPTLEAAAERARAGGLESPGYVVFITVLILLGLFLVQRHGTARIGTIFGPVILVWFATIGLLGLISIAHRPDVLAAINPWHAFDFCRDNRGTGFVVLGSVFLVVTGGEALYADMGHFGRSPIRLGWFYLALPALLLNYFGQGALLLREPRALLNPFYYLVPGWALYPMVGLATLATIIASQAVISGAFSVTRQAVQLGYFPRIPITHTSSLEIGQIYIPSVNWMLLLATIGLVIGFGSSSNLAAAYGVAVTTTMVITTLLLFVVMRRLWHWSLPWALGITGFFLVFDLAFFGATLLKIGHGGWFPLVIGASIYILMSTWRRGRQLLRDRLSARILSLENFVQSISISPPHRVNGTAVYMSGNPDGTPPVLLHNLKHNQVLHQTVVFLTIITEEVPHVPAHERIEVQGIGEGFYRVKAHFGFMESPHVPEMLEMCKPHGIEFNMMTTTFFLGRETLLASEREGLPLWRKRLFAFMSRNAQTAMAFFEIPPGQVVELGVRVEL